MTGILVALEVKYMFFWNKKMVCHMYLFNGETVNVSLKKLGYIPDEVIFALSVSKYWN